MKQFIPRGNLVACDTETTGLSRWRGDRAFLFSFCNENGRTSHIEFDVEPDRTVNYESNPEGYNLLAKFFRDKNITKVFHNAKFDIGMIQAAGLVFRGKFHETTFAAHNCNSSEDNYKLKHLAKKYADYDTEDEDDLKKAVISLRRQAKNFEMKLGEEVEQDYWLTQYADQLLSPEKARGVRILARTYAECDAERTMLLWLMYEKIMEEMDVRFHYDHELEVLKCIQQMENNGVYVDPVLVESSIRAAEGIIRENEHIFVREVGPRFNPKSGPQKIEYFINTMGFTPLAYTAKSRQPQVDNDFLESIESKSPLARAILDHSRAIKAKNTYLENYRVSMDASCRIHASLKATTATGRLSCTDPNLQNVPVRVPVTSAMYLVRKPFGPAPGNIWYLGDYAQIEARIFADEADEKHMMEACRGSDVYAELVKIIERVTGIKISRQHAKTIFLGKIYGLGKRKLIANLQCGEAEGQELINTFDDMFPRAKQYMKETIREIYDAGHVRTRYGKRLVVDQNFAYKGVNYKIQGNAAGLMKKAMLRCQAYLDQIGYGKMVLSVHDELIFEFPIDNRPISVLRHLRSLMEDNEGVYRVPTPVDFKKATRSWTDKTPVRW